MGINPIEEVLRENPKRILRVYVSFSSKVKDRKKGLLQRLQREKIPIEKRESSLLQRQTNSSSHQGIIAQVLPKKLFSLKELFRRKKERSLILFLDEIYDPQNLGAILRTGECFSVDAVCYTKGAGLSPAVSKASSGASEMVPLIEIKNWGEEIKTFKKEGFSIISLQMKEKAKDIRFFTFPKKTVLILGSEGKGIQPRIQKLSDLSLYIPLQGKISSLNVSQAAAIAIFCYQMLRR